AIRYFHVTGVQTCALPISEHADGPYDRDDEHPDREGRGGERHPVARDASRRLDGHAGDREQRDTDEDRPPGDRAAADEEGRDERSEERRVGKVCSARGSGG